MKYLIVLALVFGAISASAAAKKKDQGNNAWGNNYNHPQAAKSQQSLGMSGCGLGSMVVEDKSKWSQVASAFLNGTGFQTFAISFGTSNCNEDGVVQTAQEKQAFIEANFADLKHDISSGSGEYVAALASLYGCKGDQAKQFSGALKANATEVLKSDAIETHKAIDAVCTKELSSSCNG